ncbi:MAG: hypothetical protein Q8P58_02210 [Candidatus Adlerbacteria bacterium]|nr:hypothetical protein [Candidatus Adlerbacteria bacterium]
MVDYSPEEARKRFQALPPEVKELLYSPEMTFTMQEVGKKNGLHIDQIDALNTETGEVMLGLATTQEFVTNLMEMLRIDRAKAEAVASDVNDMLFSRIRNSMKGADNQSTPSTTTPLAQPTKPALSSQLPTSSPTPPSPKPAPPSTPAPVTKPQVPLAPHPHDLMLVEKTVTTPATPAKTPTPNTPAGQTPKPEPPKPQGYKSDPYREPPEP